MRDYFFCLNVVRSKPTQQFDSEEGKHYLMNRKKALYKKTKRHSALIYYYPSRLKFSNLASRSETSESNATGCGAWAATAVFTGA